MHRQLFDSGGHWAGELDGAYFALAAARRHEVPQASHPFLERGERELRWEPLDADWLIHRYIVQRCGVALSGPPPSELIDPVSSDELRQAVRGLLSGWWTDMHGKNQHILQHLGYRFYAVQTMCRALHTLATGTLISKRQAAGWGLNHLPERFHWLIRASLGWPREDHPGSFERTLELVGHTVAAAVARSRPVQ